MFIITGTNSDSKIIEWHITRDEKGARRCARYFRGRRGVEAVTISDKLGAAALRRRRAELGI